MTKLPATDPFELAFAETDKTDAILVVEGKKLHVNKALLSIHSDYFNTLFNSEFKEKSMSEIEIKDVEFEDFVTLLSLIMPETMPLTIQKGEKLLELSDRFLIPAAKRHVELFIAQSDMDKEKKLILADKFDSEILRNNALAEYKERHFYNNIGNVGKNFSQTTKNAIFDVFFQKFQHKL
ncbi:Protein CBG23560 [Caenorhabditis briggsae]|uniref:BTB domain-containing protein n=2 Tax=Caenorhabditis briggsae TaxID=6238 RepID=A0AAE9A684_CAEBR|nr:Protein CBG23558 [Caenorhabditis briggsae]XP_002647792.1 Protein CBG23560 [Caenorhabditis briggsae]ULT92285.1 hypothetical protein L3Y34_009800 [Caenorhabditis briggsae]ULT92286.1 hypothetical protein L3Y34_009801 [Caenorhabditis briggsae]CAP20385.1 Protein CBG23558 [Caenorhabditis briggsae]CAP20387.1 Protein CBG23560 [Caenorhabditis briggsae]